MFLQVTVERVFQLAESVKQRHFDGYCNQCGMDTRNRTALERANSSMARVTSVEHMGTRTLIVQPNEPSEEPVGMESLE